MEKTEKEKEIKQAEENEPQETPWSGDLISLEYDIFIYSKIINSSQF